MLAVKNHRHVFSKKGDLDLLLPFSYILIIKEHTIDNTGALDENPRNSRQHR